MGYIDVRPPVKPAQGAGQSVATKAAPPCAEDFGRLSHDSKLRSLTNRSALAIAKAVGLDPSKVVEVAITFDSPGLAYVTAKTAVTDGVMADVLAALRAVD